MNRLLKVLLSLNSLRKTLGFTKFFAATKFDHHIKEIKDLDFKNVLVLAPHPDDDVLGLGGTLFKLAKNGARINVAYFCDGAGGVPIENKDRDLRDLGLDLKKDKSLIEKRKIEAQKSAKILGISHQVFFGYPDGELASGSSAVRALVDLIERSEPAIIFTPSFLDNHPDHRVTNEILMNALSSYKYQENLEIWAYEVWTPTMPNRLVSISDVLEQKKEAVRAHESQLQARDYLGAIVGLNQYRAEINDMEGFAEAFFATTPQIYRDLYKKS